MASGDNGTDGPYIVWSDYGVDGWSPRSFDTLKEAIEDHNYTMLRVITRRIDYEVTEKP